MTWVALPGLGLKWLSKPTVCWPTSRFEAKNVRAWNKVKYSERRKEQAVGRADFFGAQKRWITKVFISTSRNRTQQSDELATSKFKNIGLKKLLIDAEETDSALRWADRVRHENAELEQIFHNLEKSSCKTSWPLQSWRNWSWRIVNC